MFPQKKFLAVKEGMAPNECCAKDVSVLRAHYYPKCPYSCGSHFLMRKEKEEKREENKEICLETLLPTKVTPDILAIKASLGSMH